MTTSTTPLIVSSIRTTSIDCRLIPGRHLAEVYLDGFRGGLRGVDWTLRLLGAMAGGRQQSKTKRVLSKDVLQLTAKQRLPFNRRGLSDSQPEESDSHGML